MQVFIVEDDESNLDVVSIILQSEGYEVIESTGGQDGYQLALDNKPDLIFHGSPYARHDRSRIDSKK